MAITVPSDPSAQPRPFKLIQPDGQPQFGIFKQPVTELNQADFIYRTPMDKLASRLARWAHYKQFQFVSICHPDWILAAAIADIRYLCSGFAYLYQREDASLTEFKLLQPLSRNSRMSDSPTAGLARITGGANRISIQPQGFSWQLTLQSAELSANLHLTPGEAAEPLALCLPTGYSGWTYTQKHNALQVSGEIQLKQQPIALDSALGGYDFSAGYMRRETSWRWGSLSGYDGQHRIGFNLAAGVNETGGTENCCWLNGKRYLLPPLQFVFNRQQPDASWQVFSQCGTVQLQFIPAVKRQERLNLGLLASNFRQYCGSWHGTITLCDGQKISCSGQQGLAEDHFARW
ncbi:MAG: hypothetical protein CML20_01675 [Rheinheimera sp.]|uniref:DUF2804 domain-containing protein n=1 Tax=Arsukibacterium sp. UBA3155 TaxID=1946058 RepID=UPI000C9945DA|nr:DUF2804 domain-containing protein [Arsukibacterium sp. UBA3155]MAD73510.1 hypothetical protein [Rheinheimera sp.]|tara:strand:+ start:53450 stop:54490 length:1041 start_codon:yes stop_codon:yes gene_type:complete